MDQLYSTCFVAKSIGLLARFQNVACTAVSLVCHGSIRAKGDSLLSFSSKLNLKFNIICLTETRLTDLEQPDSVFQNYKA